MFTSAELIQALQRRLRRSIRPQRPMGEFPPGWQAWFDALSAMPGRVTGATREAIAAVLAARVPVFARGYERINTAQALVRLWRSHGRDRDRGERRAHRTSIALTLLVHVFWVLALMVLMHARFTGVAPDDARSGEESLVQVEFIGEGTPDDDAGGSPAADDRVDDLPAAATQGTAPPAAVEAAAPPLPEPAQAPAAPDAVPPIPAQQPLQITETETPDDSAFVVPPVRVDGIRAPDVAVRPPTVVRQPVVRSLDAPAVPPTLRPLPQRERPVPETRTPDRQAEVRELPMQPARAALRAITTPQVETPTIKAEATAATRAIPMPSPPATPAREPGRDTATAASERPSTGRGATSPAAVTGQGARPAATASGSGVTATTDSGALPTPRRGDDWGDATRNRPGGSSGLFNADGSPRLAGNAGAVGGGLPPGTITEDYEKIDRMGTWLKRPPTDYEPTSFDRFWIPQETLLQEWVRRSIKEVLIPIPGTGKSIRCAVALLALGGACGIFDPNMLDIEAEARPPPDVPFKPDLHDDQDSLRKPPAGD